MILHDYTFLICANTDGEEEEGEEAEEESFTWIAFTLDYELMFAAGVGKAVLNNWILDDVVCTLYCDSTVVLRRIY